MIMAVRTATFFIGEKFKFRKVTLAIFCYIKSNGLLILDFEMSAICTQISVVLFNDPKTYFSII